jgi:hypothetical protein
VVAGMVPAKKKIPLRIQSLLLRIQSKQPLPEIPGKRPRMP